MTTIDLTAERQALTETLDQLTLPPAVEEHALAAVGDQIADAIKQSDVVAINVLFDEQHVTESSIQVCQGFIVVKLSRVDRESLADAGSTLPAAQNHNIGWVTCRHIVQYLQGLFQQSAALAFIAKPGRRNEQNQLFLQR